MQQHSDLGLSYSAITQAAVIQNKDSLSLNHAKSSLNQDLIAAWGKLKWYSWEPEFPIPVVP